MSAGPQGTVLYDAACGLCRRLARRWTPALERYGFTVAPLQSPWVPSRTGLDEHEPVAEIRLIRVDGELISGPDVYRAIMRRIWWAYPGYLLSLAPGLRRLFDWTYRTVARHRGAISASCGLSVSDDAAG